MRLIEGQEKKDKMSVYHWKVKVQENDSLSLKEQPEKPGLLGRYMWDASADSRAVGLGRDQKKRLTTSSLNSLVCISPS